MREHNTTERALAHAKEIKHKIRDMHKQQKRNTKTKKKRKACRDAGGSRSRAPATLEMTLTPKNDAKRNV